MWQNNIALCSHMIVYLAIPHRWAPPYSVQGLGFVFSLLQEKPPHFLVCVCVWIYTYICTYHMCVYIWVFFLSLILGGWHVTSCGIADKGYAESDDSGRQRSRWLSRMSRLWMITTPSMLHWRACFSTAPPTFVICLFVTFDGYEVETKLL